MLIIIFCNKAIESKLATICTVDKFILDAGESSAMKEKFNFVFECDWD